MRLLVIGFRSRKIGKTPCRRLPGYATVGYVCAHDFLNSRFWEEPDGSRGTEDTYARLRLGILRGEPPPGALPGCRRGLVLDHVGPRRPPRRRAVHREPGPGRSSMRTGRRREVPRP